MKQSTLSRKDRAELAFAANCAILKAQAADPILFRNPFWTMLRQDSYERFMEEFEAMK